MSLAPLTALPDLLEIALLVTALFITISDSIARVVNTYRVQSVLLALVTGITALIKLQSGGSETSLVVVLILLIVILPLALAFLIRFLLARATALPSASQESGSPRRGGEAERTWREDSETTVTYRSRNAIVFVGLVTLAFLIAFQIIAGQFTTSDRIGLMVSLTLLLAGLLNMVLKRNIISQTIGLLVMDQGLYLAVVKIVAIPVPATFFVVSLYFYTLITLFILIFLLPRVRQFTETIDLEKIAADSELKG